MDNMLIEKSIWPIVFLLFAVFFSILFRKEISEFIKEIGWLKTKWFELKRIREEIFARADEVRQLSKELNQDKQELKKAIITFTETLYLTLSTRHKFPIPQKVSDKITKNLNYLANLAIKGKREEAVFKKRMKGILYLLEKEVN